MSKKCRVLRVEQENWATYDPNGRTVTTTIEWTVTIRYGRTHKNWIAVGAKDELDAWRIGMQYTRELKYDDGGRYDRKKTTKKS